MPRYDFWERNDFNKLTSLMTDPLFENCLAPDIALGKVFPAIRGRKVDFYCKGQKLFSFTGDTFQSNVAYLAAFEQRPKGEVTEEQFRSMKVCQSFRNGYSQIKANISLYEQPESGSVFRLCRKFSSFKAGDPPVIGVLDIELSLAAQDSSRSQDRIDLVLLDQASKQIRCFEAKTLSNNEIWPRKGDAKVRSQIARYTQQLRRRQETLLSSYQQYIRIMNRLCGVSLAEPEKIDTEVDLLLFGFTSQQQKMIKDELIPGFRDEFRCCMIGSTNSATAKTLQKWWNNR